MFQVRWSHILHLNFLPIHLKSNFLLQLVRILTCWIKGGGKPEDEACEGMSSMANPLAATVPAAGQECKNNLKGFPWWSEKDGKPIDKSGAFRASLIAVAPITLTAIIVTLFSSKFWLKQTVFWPFYLLEKTITILLKLFKITKLSWFANGNDHLLHVFLLSDNNSRKICVLFFPFQPSTLFINKMTTWIINNFTTILTPKVS